MKYKFLLLLVILVNTTGLFSGILEPDGDLYAYIAKQIAQHNDFINLYNNTDWLDKPHFPFWITAISFKALGINSFAYKLPAFLFWIIGIYYLYLLGKSIYNEKTAAIAIIIYATAFQAAIGLFDVRAEHYLTALMIASIYYLYKLYYTGKIKYVFLAALFSACAVMTKGIFFLTTIVSGLAIMFIVKKEWLQLTNYKWYLYLLLTFIFTLPELYCLYVQFDLHPEKIVYGKANVSGLHFFFWDSQFGRFFNTGPIKGKGSIFFFFHTILWAFLPWSILLYTAIIRLIREKRVLYKPAQWIITGSFAFTFLIFSLSRFQLPYYLIILFPQCALLCADYLINKENTKGMRSFIIIQRILLITGLFFIEALTMIFGLSHYGYIIVSAIVVASVIFYYAQEKNTFSFIVTSVGFFITMHLFLNIFFYPALLQYQSGETAAKWFNDTIRAENVGLYKAAFPSFNFYVNSKVTATDILPARSADNIPVSYYFTTKKNADSLFNTGYPVTVLKSFPNFHISQLKVAFLYKDIRASQLDSTVIFKLKSN